MQIAAVGRAFPAHYYDQETLTAALAAAWGTRHHNLQRLTNLHKNVLVGGRHLALPIEDYDKLTSFTVANDAFIRVGTDLGAQACADALRLASLQPHDIDHIF